MDKKILFSFSSESLRGDSLPNLHVIDGIVGFLQELFKNDQIVKNTFLRVEAIDIFVRTIYPHVGSIISQSSYSSSISPIPFCMFRGLEKIGGIPNANFEMEHVNENDTKETSFNVISELAHRSSRTDPQVPLLINTDSSIGISM